MSCTLKSLGLRQRCGCRHARAFRIVCVVSFHLQQLSFRAFTYQPHSLCKRAAELGSIMGTELQHGQV